MDLVGIWTELIKCQCILWLQSPKITINYFMYDERPQSDPPTPQSSCISTKPVYSTSSVTYSEMTGTHDLGLKSER